MDSAWVFQQLVSQTLARCKGAMTYIDDILIFGAIQEEHDTILLVVLQKLAEKDFHMQLGKCHFSVSELTFVRHMISEDNGISPDPKNVQPILNAPAPMNLWQLWNFLGMITHYSNFLLNLATISKPLQHLHQKETGFVWDKRCQEAFDTLKSMVTNLLKIYIFKPNALTYVSMDASTVGLGAVCLRSKMVRKFPSALQLICYSNESRIFWPPNMKLWQQLGHVNVPKVHLGTPICAATVAVKSNDQWMNFEQVRQMGRTSVGVPLQDVVLAMSQECHPRFPVMLTNAKLWTSHQWPRRSSETEAFDWSGAALGGHHDSDSNRQGPVYCLQVHP